MPKLGSPKKVRAKFRAFLRTKYGYLVVDKVFLGAIAAGIMLLYNSHMASQQQAFEKSQAEQQRQFEKAQYISQLLPQVLDTKSSPQLRVNALGALIDTGAVDAESSVRIAQALLLDKAVSGLVDPFTDVDGLTGQVVDLDSLYGDVGAYLSAELSREMPEALPFAYQDYQTGMFALKTDERLCQGGLVGIYDHPAPAIRIKAYKDNPGSCMQAQELETNERFWAGVIAKAIDVAADEQIGTAFTRPGAAGLLRIALDRDTSTLQRWFRRSPFEVREAGLVGLIYQQDQLSILEKAGIKTLRVGTGEDLDSAVVSFLELTDPYGGTILDDLRAAGIESPTVARLDIEQTIQKMKHGTGAVCSNGSKSDCDLMALHGSFSYLLWAAQFPVVARTISGPIVHELDAYVSSIKGEAPRAGGGGPLRLDAFHEQLVGILAQPDCVNGTSASPSQLKEVSQLLQKAGIDSVALKIWSRSLSTGRTPSGFCAAV